MRESETLWLVAESVEALISALMAALMAEVVLITWLSSLVDGYLTFCLAKSLLRVWWVASSSHIASKEDSRMRSQLEVGRLVAVEARVWSLEQGSFLGLYGSLKETRT